MLQVRAQFFFRFENGQWNQSFLSVHDQKTAETSQLQAQPTDGWRAIDRALTLRFHEASGGPEKSLV